MPQLSAIDTAVRFGEIPFAEFTKDLVTNTFDALVQANVQQTQAYVEMVKILSQDLSTYVNETHDEIPLSDIIQLIETIELPNANDVQNLITAVTAGYEEALSGIAPPSSLPITTTNTSNPIAEIIQALTPIVPQILDAISPAPNSAVSDYTSIVDTTGQIYGQSIDSATQWYQYLYKAISGKIANDKYTLLQNMARMGMLRLVVDSGKIETKITFNTYEEHVDTSESSEKEKIKEKDKKVKVKQGFLGGIFQFSNNKKNKTKKITINTAKDYHRDVSGSSVQIYGGVVINFKTDYLPLNSSNG